MICHSFRFSFGFTDRIVIIEVLVLSTSHLRFKQFSLSVKDRHRQRGSLKRVHVSFSLPIIQLLCPHFVYIVYTVSVTPARLLPLRLPPPFSERRPVRPRQKFSISLPPFFHFPPLSFPSRSSHSPFSPLPFSL